MQTQAFPDRSRSFFPGAQILLLIALLLVSGCSDGTSGGDTAIVVDQERSDRIAANLRHEIPQWRQAEVVVDSIRASDFTGFDEGKVHVNGGAKYDFLVTKDDEALFIIASKAVDVSRSKAELDIELMSELKEAEREAEERHADLEAFVAGRPVLGNPEAPVTIIEFSDFQCPYCFRGYTTVEKLLDLYPEEVKFVYLHFPLANHPWARPASIATECAAAQDESAFWALYHDYFAKQKEITVNNLSGHTRRLLQTTGINMDTWADCAENESSEAYKAAAQIVNEDFATGQKYGVSGTPGFFVNGKFLRGARPQAEFEALIQQYSQQGAVVEEEGP